jgi:hypothetical protein
VQKGNGHTLPRVTPVARDETRARPATPPDETRRDPRDPYPDPTVVAGTGA